MGLVVRSIPQLGGEYKFGLCGARRKKGGICVHNNNTKLVASIVFLFYAGALPARFLAYEKRFILQDHFFCTVDDPDYPDELVSILPLLLYYKSASLVIIAKTQICVTISH